MFAHDQLRPAIGFRCEVARRAKRETGDPVAAPNRGVFVQMEQRNVFAYRQMPDPRVGGHYELVGEDPRNTDPACRIDPVAEALLKKPAAQRPWQ
jgi:hypothetical protein